MFGVDFWKKSNNVYDNRLLVQLTADGARHMETQEGDVNIISFNFSIINSRLLRSGYTSTQSHNILTVLQITADEKPDVCLTLFEQLLTQINKFKSQDLPEKYQHLDLEFVYNNNRKMLYALTQHSLFNQEFYVNLICKYKRGNSIRRKCIKIT